MKAKKALKRLNEVEVLLSDVSYKYVACTTKIKEALGEAKAAIIRAN